jgi:hypothetical protein
MHVYVNGVNDDGSQAGFPAPSSQVNSTVDLFFGETPQSGGVGNFDGKLDGLRVYNRALSASEVKQLYLLGK